MTAATVAAPAAPASATAALAAAPSPTALPPLIQLATGSAAPVCDGDVCSI